MFSVLGIRKIRSKSQGRALAVTVAFLLLLLFSMGLHCLSSMCEITKLLLAFRFDLPLHTSFKRETLMTSGFSSVESYWYRKI